MEKYKNHSNKAGRKSTLIMLILGLTIMSSNVYGLDYKVDESGSVKEGYVPFKPKGTMNIKVADGSTVSGILNTVIGFPLKAKQGEQVISIELDDIKRVELSEDKTKITVTGNSSTKTNTYELSEHPKIYLITKEGIKQITINDLIFIEVDGSITPDIPLRYNYIETKTDVFEVPAMSLIYHLIESGSMGIPSKNNSVGLEAYGRIRLNTDEMKYLRFCTETENYGKEKNSIFVNVYKNDNSTFSTFLACHSYFETYIIAPTAYGEMKTSIKNGNITGIHFGNYYPDLSKSVKNEVWKPASPDTFIAKGTAKIYLNDGTVITTPANTLQYEERRSITTMNSYLEQYEYLSDKYSSVVYFVSAKEIVFSQPAQSPDKIISRARMINGETNTFELKKEGKIYAYGNDGLEEIELQKISKIEIDMSKNTNISLRSDVKITDANGYVYLTPEYALDFILSNSGGMFPSGSKTHKIVTLDGFSFNYNKVKRIDFFMEDNKPKFKLLLKEGRELTTEFNMSNYYISYLQFLTSQGMLHLSLLYNEIKSIEFPDK